MLYKYRPGDKLAFDYMNHRGEVSTRSVIFLALCFGSNEYYPEEQWFLHGFDLNKDAERSFSLDRIAGENVRRF